MKPSSRIRHFPYGLSPYKKNGYERSPADPMEGDAVVVNAVIESDAIIESSSAIESDSAIEPGLGGTNITLLWRHNGIAREPITPSKLETPAPGKICCTFELGKFRESDKIDYRFQLEEQNGTISSEEYGFTVFKRYRSYEIDALDFIDNGLTIRFKKQGRFGEKLRLSFENGGLRMFYTLGGLPAGGRGSSSFEEAGGGPSIFRDSESGYYAEIFKKPFRFTIKDRDGNMLLESPQGPSGPMELYGNSNGGVRSAKLSFKTCNDHYYGFGERFNKVDQAGENPDVHVTEQFTNQKNAAYLPMPFFVTEKNYGMFLNSSFHTGYSLASGSDRLFEVETRINEESPFVDLYVLFGTPKDIIKKYLDITGHPALPPKWAFGPWMSSNRWNTQAETVKQVDTTVKHDIPATVVVLEAWSDETTFYIFNDAKYKARGGDEFLKYGDFVFEPGSKWPDPAGMVDYIHSNGMKLVLWQVPVIKYVKDTDNEQHIADEEYVIKAGFCVSNNDGSPYRIPDNWFSGSLIPDFTSPAAVDWWFKKRRYLIKDLGVDGFKTDGAEFVYHDDLVFHNGKKGEEMRNMYPVDYIAGYHGFIGENRVTFSRAGFTGAQKYPVYWAGDQESTFTELRSVLNAGLSINLSGNPFWSFDIAGFYGPLPGAELYIRSTEMAAFCPIMQYHSAPTDDGANNDRTPWNISEWNSDPRVLEIYRRYANMRMNLLPYIYQEARYIAQNCEPFMRHLIVDYANDENVYGIDDEYMLGRELLVAPVINEGSRRRDIYLPGGEWIDYWDGSMYEGGRTVSYSCDIDKIPVFIKNNSVIPMNLNKDFEIGGSIGNAIDRYINLCFVVNGRIDGEYVFTDDLGTCVRITGGPDGLAAEVAGDIGEVYIAARDALVLGRVDFVARLNGTEYHVRGISRR